MWQNEAAQQQMGLSRASFFRARRELVNKGLIEAIVSTSTTLVRYTLKVIGAFSNDCPSDAAAVSMTGAETLQSEGEIVATVRETGESMAVSSAESKAAPARVTCVKESLGLSKQKDKQTTTTAALLRKWLNVAGLGNRSELASARLGDWFSRRPFQETEALIEQAINRAASAPRPSMNYVIAVLRSWEEKGLQTIADVAEEQTGWRKKRTKKPKKERNPNDQLDQCAFTREYPNAVF
ncbi:hypothetical protein JCM19045_854 [Bacillus sp. JCM 19045]|nr:hypothetical protein JCM19045_854 [Bacillus sp. JCM 19045]